MKTFGDLKVGDVVFSKALECNVIIEQRIERISLEKDIINIKFVNDPFSIAVPRDTRGYVRSSIVYFSDKKEVIPCLKTIVKNLKHELQVCEQLLKHYELESVK